MYLYIFYIKNKRELFPFSNFRYIKPYSLEVQRKWNIHKTTLLRPCKGPHKNLEAKNTRPLGRLLGWAEVCN